MADVAEREGVAVICRDSSRLRDDVYGAPVLGFAGSPERKPQKPPIPRRNLPRGFNGLGGPRAGAGEWVEFQKPFLQLAADAAADPAAHNQARNAAYRSAAQ